MRSLSEFLTRAGHRDEAERLGIPSRLDHARRELERVSALDYLGALAGTIGADPIHRPARGRGEREAWDAPDARGLTHPVGAGG